MIEELINFGETIKSYPDDKPFPSYLILGFVNQQPLHIVLAKNEQDAMCIIVTAYFPQQEIWDNNFKTKK